MYRKRDLKGGATCSEGRWYETFWGETVVFVTAVRDSCWFGCCNGFLTGFCLTPRGSARTGEHSPRLAHLLGTVTYFSYSYGSLINQTAYPMTHACTIQSPDGSILYATMTCIFCNGRVQIQRRQEYRSCVCGAFGVEQNGNRQAMWRDVDLYDDETLATVYRNRTFEPFIHYSNDHNSAVVGDGYVEEPEVC